MAIELVQEVVPEDLAIHPAVMAWREIQPCSPLPASLESVKGEFPKRVVFRLKEAGPDHSDIIVKRCYRKTGYVERVVYEDILPCLPISVPHYFGFLEADDDYCWLFLEDVGEERFSPFDEAQRQAAAQWLGAMHIGALGVPAATQLPDRGSGHYLDHLKTGRQAILDNLDNPVFDEEHIEVLKAVLTQCDLLESKWDRLEAVSLGLPYTLAHGDFRPKNIRLRTYESEVTLWPIDWETSGWGTPIVDIAPARHHPSHAQVDLAIYLSLVQGQWPHIDLADLKTLALVGQIFRRLAAINWASMSLKFQWPEKPVSSLKIYHDDLVAIVPLVL